MQFLLNYGAVPDKEDLINAVELKSKEHFATDEELVQMLLDHIPKDGRYDFLQEY